jgi:hypothetical protein
MAEVTDVLAFWHPTKSMALDEHWFQWGVVVPGSSADKQFRVRNLSNHYTARSITVTFTELGSPARSVAAQHYLSRNGTTFTATLGLGDMQPGGVSTVLTVRRVVAADADEGDGDFQLLAHADDWE